MGQYVKGSSLFPNKGQDYCVVNFYLMPIISLTLFGTEGVLFIEIRSFRDDKTLEESL